MVAKDTSGIVEAIRQLGVARDGAVKERTAALNALGGLIVTAPEDLRRQLTARKAKRARARLCERLRPDLRRLREPEQAAKAALRSLARRITELDGEIKLLDQQLARLIAEAAPITINRLAVGTGHAATLLVTAGQNIERLRHESSFAALCAAGPVPVSSGRTDRHRLNHGGDRDANRALHVIAVCRPRHCERTAPTPRGAPPRARPRPRSSAVSSATSPASSTTPCGRSARAARHAATARADHLHRLRRRTDRARDRLLTSIGRTSGCAQLRRQHQPDSTKLGGGPPLPAIARSLADYSPPQSAMRSPDGP